MLPSILLAGLLAAGIDAPARPVELTSIERVILKEPVYSGKPKYCLLVFGKEAKTHVWLVGDDKHYYVDRNSNGDLTEPNEKVPLLFSGANFIINGIVKRDGAANGNLHVMRHGDGTFEMTFGSDSNRTQYVGVDLMDRPTWGDKAANAPIIHFDGPMSFERYGPIVAIPRGGNGGKRRFSLRLMLGTPGVGKGTFASYDEICSEQLGPIQADVVYTHRNGSGEMFEQRIQLLHDG